ncbi:MAG: PPC domain-containing protein, partial [Planctomycetales bacterium]|nr:PPC domain-containing protein [Planctomycetales bacterium]
MDGLRAADGPYYVVVTGFEGQSNPYYELRINAPEPVRPDVYENNDTRGTASNLGVVRGWRMLADRDRPLSIEANDDDWYRFEIAATADSGHFVAIAFDHALGDLDLALYDSSGDELDASRTANQIELLSLATLTAGVYYARVSGNNGADNPRYSLGILAPGVADVDPYEINDTLSDATDFGLVTGVETLTGLSLHDDSDIDVFTFEMAATGQRGHGVEIAFGHTRGDLDLAIVGPDGQRRESVSVSNMEHISLDGMPAGVYRVEVFGKANPSYSLMLRTPEPDGDFAEATAGKTNNDSKADAYDLRTILGRQTLNDLSIHSVTDVDWYRFDLAADAAANHYAAISFDARIGDLDLYLVDSAGTVLRASETLEGVERVSLTDLAADQGPYYLQVEGHRGATNPSYALQINGPAADVRSDWAEPNDSRQTSHSLQQIEGVQTWSQLSLHSDSDVDWYEFTMLPGTVGLAGHAVSITFDDAQGNLDLELYSSANPQNPLVSANVGDRERISLTGLTAEDGPFAIKVSGSANPSYTLAIDAPLDAAADWAERHADRLDNDSLASAYDLRIVQGMNSLSHLSVDPADDQDYFRFELPTGGDTVSYARIDFRHDDGDLTLQLLDAAGAELASSASSTNFEQLSLAGLAGGVYFLRIVGATAVTTNPAYTLTVAAPGGLVPDFAETNDTPAQAFNLRDVESSGARTRDGLGGTPGFFGATGFFSQPTIPSSLNTWAGQPGASLALHSTVAQAGFVPGGFLNQLAAGVNPLLLLDDSFGSTQYVNSALSFDPLAYLNDMWGATQAGVQSVANLLEGTGSFGQNTGNPYGSLLPLGGTSGLTGLAALGGLYNPYQAQSNYATAVALNQFNQQLNNLFSFTANTGLLGGTGYSPAFSYLIGGGYLSSPSCNPYSSFQIIGGPPPCRNIAGDGVVEDSAVRLDDLSLHNGNDEDWFRFELSRDGREGQFARVTLGDERRNIELTLFADDVVTSPTSTLPIDRVEAFAAEFGVPLAGLASGTYFLRIRGDAVENYVLEIDATPAVELTGDWSEKNDTQADAFDLRKVEGTQEYGQLSIHNSMDQDWFEFETTAVGLPGHFVQIGFRNADGDLDLTLFDNQGTEVGRSGGVQNEERVSLDGLPA